MRFISAFAVAAAATLVAAEPAKTSSTSSFPPHAVVSEVAPQQSPPPGCSPNYEGDFEIAPVNYTSVNKRSVFPYFQARDTKLFITLKGGVLTDSQNRTGYIASNNQFQFDDPPQAGAKYTAGFSICQNTSLALGNDLIWYRCLSGGFGNLYTTNIGSVCIKSYIIARPVNGGHVAPVPASLSTVSFSSTATSNGTATGSNSASASASGTGVAPGHATTRKTTAKVTQKQTNTGASPTGTASTPASSSSTSSGSNAAATHNAGSAMFGLAGGLMAFAAMV